MRQQVIARAASASAVAPGAGPVRIVWRSAIRPKTPNPEACQAGRGFARTRAPRPDGVRAAARGSSRCILPRTARSPTSSPMATTVPGSAAASGRLGRIDACRKNPQRRIFKAGFGDRPGVERADLPVDLGGASLPVDARLGLYDLVSVAHALLGLGVACRVPRARPSSASSSVFAPSFASASWRLPEVSVAPMASGRCSRMGPVSRPAAMRITVMPVVASPARSAR